jgi:hypothetical protein
MNILSLYKKLAVGLLAISLSVITEISAAALIYEQSPVNPVDGPLADINAGTGLFADNFTIAHSNLESISWWGAYLSEETDDFVIRLYSNLGGTGTLLNDFRSVSFVQNSLFDSLNTPYHHYQFDFTTPIELAAGTYYLSIQNQGTSSWVWLYGNPGNSSFWNLPVSTSDWAELTNQPDLAFRLEGSPIQSVPEPNITMLMLLGGGMLAISFKRIRRHKRVC